MHIIICVAKKKKIKEISSTEYIPKNNNSKTASATYLADIFNIHLAM